MRVLVTGGAGFIGRWVVRALLSRGDSVTALDDLSNGREENVAEFQSQAFRLVRGDVAKAEEVASAFRDDFDLCLHLAAMIEVQKSIDNPARAYQVNCTGTLNILEACRSRATRVVLVGTCMVYDTAGSSAIAETHPVNPASPYAATKLAAEYLGLSYRHAYGLPVTILRPFNVYGPHQKANQEGGVVAVFARRALDGKPIEVFGDGTQTRDLMYVEDCAEFILAAAGTPTAAGEILNAGTGRDIAINDLARLVGGPSADIRHVKHPHPQSEVRRLRCDPSKAKRLLGWAPRTSLETGVARLKEWMAG